MLARVGKEGAATSRQRGRTFSFGRPEPSALAHGLARAGRSGFWRVAHKAHQTSPAAFRRCRYLESGGEHGAWAAPCFVHMSSGKAPARGAG
jgi:hypothetical protein